MQARPAIYRRYTSDITVWNVREVPVPVEPRFDPVIHEPMRLRICGILSTVDEMQFAALRDTLDISDAA